VDGAGNIIYVNDVTLPESLNPAAHVNKYAGQYRRHFDEYECEGGPAPDENTGFDCGLAASRNLVRAGPDWLSKQFCALHSDAVYPVWCDVNVILYLAPMGHLWGIETCASNCSCACSKLLAKCRAACAVMNGRHL
jgi:hypothetical protein